MNKLIVIPNNIDTIYSTYKYCKGFILGIQNFSVNIELNLNKEKLRDIIKFLNENNKEIFILLNKNITNNDLDELKEILLFLNNNKINGVIFYDLAIVNLKEKLQLNYDLIWGQEHFTTNYQTVNEWYKEGIKTVLLSSDITLDEIVEIRKNVESKLMVTIFGHLPMFISFRHLVKNYIDTFNLENGSNKYYLKDNEQYYPIINNELGTTVYSSNILNGISEYNNLKSKRIDYFILNSYNISENTFLEVLKLFLNTNDENNLEHENQINELFLNVDKGFLYKPTIYKVKNDE